MQDVGGCRAVFRDVEDVYELKNSYLNSRGQFEVVHIDDYIPEAIRLQKPSSCSEIQK